MRSCGLRRLRTLGAHLVHKQQLPVTTAAELQSCTPSAVSDTTRWLIWPDTDAAQGLQPHEKPTCNVLRMMLCLMPATHQNPSGFEDSTKCVRYPGTPIARSHAIFCDAVKMLPIWRPSGGNRSNTASHPGGMPNTQKHSPRWSVIKLT